MKNREMFGMKKMALPFNKIVYLCLSENIFRNPEMLFNSLGVDLRHTLNICTEVENVQNVFNDNTSLTVKHNIL